MGSNIDWKESLNTILKGSYQAVICSTDGVVFAKSDSIPHSDVEYWQKFIRNVLEIGIYDTEYDSETKYNHSYASVFYTASYNQKNVKAPPMKPYVALKDIKTNFRDPFAVLPSDISLEIASFIEIPSIPSAARVCKRWRQIFQDHQNSFGGVSIVIQVISEWITQNDNSVGYVEPIFTGISKNFWRTMFMMQTNSIKIGFWSTFTWRLPPLPKRSNFTICEQKYYVIGQRQFLVGINNKSGIAVFKLKSVVLICFIEKKDNVGNCLFHAGKVFDYLKDAGL